MLVAGCAVEQGPAPSVASASLTAQRSLRIVSLNIGHGRRDCCGSGAACRAGDEYSTCEAGEYCDNPIYSTRGIGELAIALRWEAPFGAEQSFVLAMQEVDYNNPRSCRLNQAEYIESCLGRDFQRHFASIRPSTDSTHYGLAYVVNAQICENETVVLRECGGDEICCAETDADPERRIAQVFRPGWSAPVWVVNAHMSWFLQPSTVSDPVTRCQAERITSHVESRIPDDDVVVLVGDLNVPLWGETGGHATSLPRDAWLQLQDTLEDAGFRRVELDGPTAPAATPDKTIDYAWIRDRAFRLSRVDAHVEDPARSDPGGEGMLTDHRAVVLDVAWDEPGVPALLRPQLVAAAL